MTCCQSPVDVSLSSMCCYLPTWFVWLLLCLYSSSCFHSQSRLYVCLPFYQCQFHISYSWPLCVTRFLFRQLLVLCVCVCQFCSAVFPKCAKSPPPLYKVCVSLCVLFRPPLWCESIHPSVCKLVFDMHCLALLLLRFCLFYLLPANKTLILGLLLSVSPAFWVHSLSATHPQSTTEGFCLGVCFSTSKHPLGVFVFFVLFFCPTKHLENCL